MTGDGKRRRPSRSRKRPRRRKPAGSGARKPPAGFQLAVAPLASKHPDVVKQKALDAFLTHGNVAAACYAAGVGRTTWYEWRQSDEVFNRLANEADEAVTDALEGVAQLRASVPDGSDTLLIFLLKARRRAKYGEKNTLTMASAEVQMAFQNIAQLIATKPSWESEELMKAIHEILK